jgi:7-cyano-7-deazaguanine synthase
METTGVLLSGGLDSAIFVGWLLNRGRRVQPFYVDFSQYWQPDEQHAVRRYLAAIAEPRLAELVVLALPVADLYGDHWSVTGKNIPPSSADDQAVFLPGHNALLVIKAALWCQLHGIAELALATLKTSPFADAHSPFFQEFESALNRAMPSPIHILHPFGRFEKREVMELGRGLPLELTFSCLAPAKGRHCGACNKCAEPHRAFALIGEDDPTNYETMPGRSAVKV